MIVPGGFGAAKNLSSFGLESDSDVEPEVKDVLRGFHAAGRPMAFTSIAAILPAMVLTKQDGVKVKVTLGQKGRRKQIILR